MDNILSEYQRWKQQGETLRTQAKLAMESRFRELLAEAARISQEYQRDFGSALKPASPITVFRFKASGVKGGLKPKKAAPPVAKKAEDPKLAGMQKRLAQAQAKLAASKAAGKPTKNLEDRIYEIEDEIRLASQS